MLGQRSVVVRAAPRRGLRETQIGFWARASAMAHRRRRAYHKVWLSILPCREDLPTQSLDDHQPQCTDNVVPAMGSIIDRHRIHTKAARFARVGQRFPCMAARGQPVSGAGREQGSRAENKPPHAA